MTYADAALPPAVRSSAELAVVNEGTHLCRHCGQVRPATEFQRCGPEKRHLRHECNRCRGARCSATRAANAEERRQKERDYYERTRAEFARRSRQRCETLDDNYVKELLRQGSTLSNAQIPDTLVQLKRDEIAMRRLARLLKEQQMKSSRTIEQGLEKLSAIATTGDVRQLIATVMMANARGELSNDTLLAQAKGGDAIANLMGAEVKVARAQIELREKGAQLGQIAHMGQMLIGNAPQGS